MGATASYFLHRESQSAYDCILDHVKPGTSSIVASEIIHACHKLHDAVIDPSKVKWNKSNPFKELDKKQSR